MKVFSLKIYIVTILVSINLDCGVVCIFSDREIQIEFDVSGDSKNINFSQEATQIHLRKELKPQRGNKQTQQPFKNNKSFRKSNKQDPCDEASLLEAATRPALMKDLWMLKRRSCKPEINENKEEHHTPRPPSEDSGIKTLPYLKEMSNIDDLIKIIKQGKNVVYKKPAESQDITWYKIKITKS